MISGQNRFSIPSSFHVHIQFIDIIQTFVLFGIVWLREYYTIEITADKITDYYRNVHRKDTPYICFKKRQWRRKIDKGICHTVRKSAYYEQRHTEKQREHISLACKINGCRHYETTSDCKKSASDCTGVQTQLQDILSRSLQIHRRQSCEKGNRQTSQYIAEKNDQQIQ